MIEFSTLSEAREAIAATNNTKLLEQTIYSDFAFVRPPPTPHNSRGGGGGRRGGGGRGGSSRPRSRSPGAKDEAAPSRSLQDRITS